MTDNDVEIQDWRVPNWRNPEEYEFADPLSVTPLINDQLRWEFLRRDKEYRNSWKDLEAVRYYFGLINPIDPRLSAKDLGDQSVLFINSVMRGNPMALAMPKLNDLDNEDFVKQYGEHVLKLSDEEGFLIIGFDPRFPTRPQIDRAGEILEFHRKQLIKERLEDAEESRAGLQQLIEERLIDAKENRVDEKDITEEMSDIFYHERVLGKPQNLLRTLDAHNEGVGPEEIGQKIFGKTHDDADGKSHARAIAHERLKKAKRCWKDISPHKRHVVL